MYGRGVAALGQPSLRDAHLRQEQLLRGLPFCQLHLLARRLVNPLFSSPHQTLVVNVVLLDGIEILVICREN
jgi:hypothetical protein